MTSSLLWWFVIGMERGGTYSKVRAGSRQMFAIFIMTLPIINRCR
jgi:hypothetical protein